MLNSPLKYHITLYNDILKDGKLIFKQKDLNIKNNYKII